MNSAVSPIMIDIQGLSATEAELEMIRSPLVGGVILFGRNCDSVEQVRLLTDTIREVDSRLLVAIDQEGGRVQRMKGPLTVLPAMGMLGKLYDMDTAAAIELSEQLGWLMAVEVLCLGVDISFAPVLDLDSGFSRVIGDRAFHGDPNVVVQLASSFCAGMKSAGMAATGKHFPGHGAVAEDSHLEFPVDQRSFCEIKETDLIPFTHLCDGQLQGIMPAHVIFPQVDTAPAGFSPKWIQQVLRKDMGFNGVVFSDDLSMTAAGVVGDIVAKAEHAWLAGCDALLVCNQPKDADILLQSWQPSLRNCWQPLASLRSDQYGSWAELEVDERRLRIQKSIQQLLYSA